MPIGCPLLADSGHYNCPDPCSIRVAEMRYRVPTWMFGAASAASALATAYAFLSAVATASLRFGHCGPTSLDHAEQYCRIGTQLLLFSYALGAFTLFLVGATVWLAWHRRRGTISGPKLPRD